VPPSAVFLPLSCQLDDAESVTWSRAVPLLIAEELLSAGTLRASYAAWTTGKGANLQICHLNTEPPVEHVAAYARAARADFGISGWGSWFGDPFVRWEIVSADGTQRRRLPAAGAKGSDRLDAVRAAQEALLLALGVGTAGPGAVLGAASREGALLAWLQDREAEWSRRRRGLPRVPEASFRYVLSALRQDPAFEPAARQVLRRGGEALASCAPGEAGNGPRSAAVEALQSLVRLRPQDVVAWTLLGMLLRANGRAEEAISALRRATAVAADYAPAHRELGGLLLSGGDLRAAGAHLRKAGQLLPRDPETHLALGELYLQLRDRSRALGHLQAAMRLAAGTAVAAAAARLVRDIDEGPVRRLTDPLAIRPAAEPLAARPAAGESAARDRDLIARTFGLGAGLDEDDRTNPGDDFDSRLEDEVTNWPG
jgi:tetratricopeptide (TPR) repeat protein